MRTQWRDGDRSRAVELSPQGNGRYGVRVDENEIEVVVEPLGPGRLRLRSDGGAVVAEITPAGERRFVRLGTLDFVLDREPPGSRRRGGSAPGGGLEAPMPGVVTRVLVNAGDEVKKGQPLVAIEAMKMEHMIRAPRDGRIAAIAARAGEMVAGGLALVEME